MNPSACYTPPRDISPSLITRNDFPNDFVFGTGISAYQNEGAAAKGGRGPSIWDAFTLNTPGRIADGSNGNVATDTYNRFKEDVKMVKKMGFDAFKISISWSRILPGGTRSAGVNREGIDYYNELIDTLLAHGVEPYVTLFFFDFPQCLEKEYGGFLSKRVVQDFVEYAELCFWEFGDRVKHWMTMNASWAYCTGGYVTCIFPPSKGDPTAFFSALEGLGNKDKVRSDDDDDDDDQVAVYCGVYEPRQVLSDCRRRLCHSDEDNDRDRGATNSNGYDPKNAYTVARNMLLAHAAAVDSYRKKFQEQQGGKIGIALNCHWFEPYNKRDDDDIKATKRALDFMLGWFLEPIMTGQYPQNMTSFVPCKNLAPFTPQESSMVKGSIDFLGLNYYTAHYAANDPNPKGQDGYYKDQRIRFYTRSRQHKMAIGPSVSLPWLCSVPHGIHKLLNYINATYFHGKTSLPIYITENGVDQKNDHELTPREGCDDQHRMRYFQSHIANVRKAIDDGVNVKGYFAWAWSDPFEWAAGYTIRFGLMYVDFKNDLARYPKSSALWFSKFLMKSRKKQTKNKHIKDTKDGC
ncbi:raucaffricine-o-beta-d-glucosidase [Phtheirospermum japonicum]|uniref:Raucaffricine-o-beta-d-glucosidase n=1 Tax=Phtheirospermum japonicum TaxID=374723 RepID=A0A830CRX9_9LAMI|nr:raucaffricine-o-beta-d-glucosidase [Phtheirospermum japonicum]